MLIWILSTKGIQRAEQQYWVVQKCYWGNNFTSDSESIDSENSDEVPASNKETINT